MVIIDIFANAQVVVLPTPICTASLRFSGQRRTFELDTIRMRTTAKGLKPFVMTNLKTQDGLKDVIAFIGTNVMLQAS